MPGVVNLIASSPHRPTKTHQLTVPFSCPDCGAEGMELVDVLLPDVMGRSTQAVLRCCRGWTLTVLLTPREAIR